MLSTFCWWTEFSQIGLLQIFTNCSMDQQFRYPYPLPGKATCQSHSCSTLMLPHGLLLTGKFNVHISFEWYVTAVLGDWWTILCLVHVALAVLDLVACSSMFTLSHCRAMLNRIKIAECERKSSYMYKMWTCMCAEAHFCLSILELYCSFWWLKSRWSNEVKSCLLICVCIPNVYSLYNWIIDKNAYQWRLQEIQTGLLHILH